MDAKLPEEKQIAVKPLPHSLHSVCMGKTVLVEMLMFFFFPFAGRVASSCVFGIRRTRESRGKRIYLIPLIVTGCEM